MLLLKNGQAIEDQWVAVNDDTPLPAGTPAIISLARWLAERETLVSRNAPLGIRLESDEQPATIAGDLAHFGVVALNFPTFGDGRPYSSARLLRERYGYRGELRATGEVLRDQVLFLDRCGFDALEVANEATAGWQEAVAEFDAFYQPAADSRTSIQVQGRERAVTQRIRHLTPEERADYLAHRYGGLDGADLLQPLIEDEFPGRIALVSSFGTEAAVTLALAAEIDPALPIVFIDTGKHFGETLRYRDKLIARLGLTDVRSVGPEDEELAGADADGTLWHRKPDACCFLRKVLPLRRALVEFDAWITGRKRYQGGLRGALPTIEAAEGKIKVNPLANWTRERVEAEFEARDLPSHPLEVEGFLSIGCMTCTNRVAPGEAHDPRAGRWTGRDKDECGIHQPATALPG